MKPALLALIASVPAFCFDPVAAGAKVFIHPSNGFGSYLNAAFRVKGVPLTQVADRAIADYEVLASAESQKASWAHVIFLKQSGSREEASMNVIDVRTSEVVFSYNYNKGNTYRGKQSAAESCAKHLEWHIRKGGRLASSLPVRPPEEITALRIRYYAETPEGKESARVAEAQKNNPPPPKMAVRFTSNPAGAELEVDGEFWGYTPTADLSRLGAGPHTVVLKKSGYQRWERKVSLAADESRVIHADMQLETPDAARPKISGLN